jgi:hypothetical protein
MRWRSTAESGSFEVVPSQRCHADENRTSGLEYLAGYPVSTKPEAIGIAS